MNINKTYQEAWDLVANELAKFGATEKDMIEVLKEGAIERIVMQGFLGGYAAAKGFGVNNDDTTWLDAKLKGE